MALGAWASTLPEEDPPGDHWDGWDEPQELDWVA